MNIFEDLGLKHVINASGRMTKLGVSTLAPEILEAMNSASSHYVEIDNLTQKAGEIISTYTHAEASIPTNSASAGIALASASVLDGLKQEILIQAGHVIDYGAPIKDVIGISKASLIPVGAVNKVAVRDFLENINDRTAAIFYVQSHHTVHKGMLNLEEVLKIGKDFDLPVIVDAAAESDFHYYIDKGADLVIYSGSKALCGPTSGFVTGKKEYIDKISQLNYRFGRSMKIGKESIAGLLKALELYHQQDLKTVASENKSKAERLVALFNDVDTLKARLIEDEAGRPIYRAQLSSTSLPITDIYEALLSGNPAIYSRDHQINSGFLNFDVRSLSHEDMDNIVLRLKEIVKER